MIIAFIPSTLSELFIRTPEILNKDEMFPKYIYFENSENFKKIKQEVLNVLNKTNNGNSISLTRDRAGGFTKEIGKDVKLDKNGIQTGWRILNIKIGDNYSADAIHFPTLVGLLKQIPEIKSCAVSILEPNVHIPVHTGYYKGFMRFMLPVIVPKNYKDVYLCLNNIKYNWTEGKSVLWDDTFPHSVYNTTDEIRVVLYMDIIRPYKGVFHTINNSLINFAIHSKVIQEEIKKTELQITNN